MEVTKKAKQLLKESIVVWEDFHTEYVLQFGELADRTHDSENCPLCLAFWGSHCVCGGCPIARDGYESCRRSGFYKWFCISDEIIDNAWIQAHLAMITYMKKLYKKCKVK